MARIKKPKATKPVPASLDSQPPAEAEQPIIPDEDEAEREVKSFIDLDRIMRRAVENGGGDTLHWWIDQQTYATFRETLSNWNYDIVAKLGTWHRTEAGYFLVAVAHTRDPYTCVCEPRLTLSDDSKNRQLTINAMVNCRVCESSDIERRTPLEWIEFADQHGLTVGKDVRSLVAQRTATELPLAPKTEHSLLRAIGGLLLLAEYPVGTPMQRLLDDLAAKGVPLDRQTFTKTVNRARAAVSGAPDPGRPSKKSRKPKT